MLKIAYSEIYAHPLPKGHRFPMEKYELIPQQLLYEGTIGHENFFSPSEVDEKWILRTHCEQYWQRLKNLKLSDKEIRKIGLPLSSQLVLREKIITQGTIMASEFAMEYGVALNVAGGTHHAFYDRGEGFCMLNDFAVAANYLLDSKAVNKIMIVDLDVHQGNGTAKLFEQNDKVFTLSMHGAHNYPLKKENSDIDIPLMDGIEDQEYLSLLKETLPKAIDSFQPEFIFYLSGVDILKTDKLGRLGVSLEGCKLRDQFVFHECIKKSIPVCVSMGGGYSQRLADIVEAHANTYRLASDMFFSEVW